MAKITLQDRLRDDRNRNHKLLREEAADRIDALEMPREVEPGVAEPEDLGSTEDMDDEDPD